LKYYIRTAVIVGPDNIYYAGNVTTYNLGHTPAGTVTWEKSAGSPFNISPTTGSTTNVTQTAGSGTGTLTAKVNGTVVATKTIRAYSPTLGPIMGPSTVYKGQTYVSFQVMPNTFPGLTYEWSAGNLVLASNNTSSSEGLFNVPNDPYIDHDMVYCNVSFNGNHVGTFSKSVYIQ
jgi:hypothetical protein